MRKLDWMSLLPIAFPIWSFFLFFKILAIIQQFPVSSRKTNIALVWWPYLCFRLYSNRPITCENSVHFVRFTDTQQYQNPTPSGANVCKVDTKMRLLPGHSSYVYWKPHMGTFIKLTSKEEVNKYTTESTQKHLTCT